ncbi:AAA family ATPase [Variovorax paradoxus]|nr:AAA family ATPase [Variovorax paradoxus]
MKLQITRLRVEQLRRFRAPLELGGFEPGLNILAAPNEAGKSTLVRAIRAAFFERHRSTAVEDLRPWGEGSGAAPLIELDFLVDGQNHRLVKSFLGKKRCTLAAGTRSFDGTEAEDHLAQLFGFSFAGKGASKPENWGIPGLLWVEQGRGQELDVSHARDHLHDALRDPAGDSAAALAASGGDAILESLRAQRDELLTSTTGKPRAAYAEAIAQVAALEAELGAIDTQVLSYRQQVDQLAEMRQQHQADEMARPWEALRQQLLDAQHRNDALQAGQEQLRNDRARLRQLQDTRELLAKELTGLAQQQTAAQTRERACEEAAKQLQDGDAAAAHARQFAADAQHRVDRARDAWRVASQEAQRRNLQQLLQQAQADAARSAESLARAEEAHARLATLQAAAAEAPKIRSAEVEQLLRLERAERDADLRRQAVATRLQFVLPEGQALELQAGEQTHDLRGEGERLIDAPATLHLPGGGQLFITPGGDDLVALARAHGVARDALRAALQACGVDDIAQARSRLNASADLDAQIKLAQQALGIVAPRGLEALRGELAQAQSRIATAQAAQERLPAAPADEPALSIEEAEAAQEAAVAAEQAAQKTLAEAQRRQSAAHEASETAQRELAAAQATLADPSRQQRHAQASQQWLTMGAEAQALTARIDLTSADVQAARPDIVLQDIDRLQRSIEQATRSHQQRRADALTLLCNKLEQKRQATLTRLQAPLQARMQHYLPLLMPGATVQMDAGLAPATLTRPNAGGATESGQLQELSFGAREQLRLISRFAYADLLQETGRPTLLILDDALVHSDAPRLVQMKRVLFDAAQRHQVLLFTCHPEHWRDMGVALRPLAP